MLVLVARSGLGDESMSAILQVDIVGCSKTTVETVQGNHIFCLILRPLPATVLSRQALVGATFVGISNGAALVMEASASLLVQLGTDRCRESPEGKNIK